MSVWGRFVLPRLIDLVLRNSAAAEERARLVPLASGVVLEIGIGSALNAPYYSADVRLVIGLDPSRELWQIGHRRLGAGPHIRYVAGSAEALPFADRSVDTVLTTWALCSIPDATAALAEMRRVLRPGGRLVFIEHGRSPELRVRRWQDRLTPLWVRVAGGCHLNRPIDALLKTTGFHPTSLEYSYGKGPKAISYFFRGVAVVRDGHPRTADPFAAVGGRPGLTRRARIL
jgi:ubiquinone/menaquinone biosynthesis C-methylase UbiE